jgi:hypothetical protein
MRSAANRLAKLIKTQRTARKNKRGPRPPVEEDRTALGIQRLRFLFIQLQCNPFMRFLAASSFIPGAVTATLRRPDCRQAASVKVGLLHRYILGLFAAT